MKAILILVHIAVCIALILIVLLQRGKGADVGAAFGGTSSQALFGTGGATSFLHKVTTVAAVIFMLTSLGLSLLSGRGTTSSIMEGVSPTETPVAEQSTTQSGTPAEPEASQ